MFAVLGIAGLSAGCGESDPLTDRANAGDVEAQLTLAGRFAAEGESQDLALATRWYEKAAVGGSEKPRCTSPPNSTPISPYTWAT